MASDLNGRWLGAEGGRAKPPRNSSGGAAELEIRSARHGDAIASRGTSSSEAMKMKQRTVLFGLAILALAIATAYSQNKTRPATAAVPHLEKRGPTTQMIVDGKPFLMLVGELANTKSSNLEEMKTRIWPMLADKIHANTIITGMSWSWVEPEEGKYDFSIADAAIENAKQHNMRICWMWFASWKNGLSSFVPTWVKANQERFPRAQILDGKTVEVLSTLSENNRNADAKAFAALMRHCREVDTPIASSWSRWKTKWAWAATHATGLRWRMQLSPNRCPRN